MEKEYINYKKQTNELNVVSLTYQLPETKNMSGNFIDDIMSMLSEPLYNVISSYYNRAGNYENYVSAALNSISNIKKCLKFLNVKQNLTKKLPENLIDKNKKILLLDIDETLLHADFDNCFKKLTNYDHILKFTKPTDDDKIINKNQKNQKNQKLENQENEFITVGIIFRPYLKEFLENVAQNFNVFIYTSSHKNYAEAVADLLDPEHKIFKMVFSREDCIRIDNQIYIKNLDIFDNLNNVVIIENSMYSFMNHISNGILVYSFYFDKNDVELKTILNYLNKEIIPADDVKIINEKLFGFQSALNEIEQTHCINEM